jgi:hypothetical protein
MRSCRGLTFIAVISFHFLVEPLADRSALLQTCPLQTTTATRGNLTVVFGLFSGPAEQAR